ncbi:hypothetical protein J2Y55_002116 [Bosea sp. BE125]|uniref:relaxase/mobilization nuclease domain-containing protein n=1 Tax=Bosea sp. BE125 TaxID=2817909 RepID=UPI00285820D2|nr:relaxase [Bosea sp. BE125]MDR6871108.1 hypothetical protein [Bosea sp. BE125]
MILVGSQRGGGANLAQHLMKLDENDHVTVVERRGFVGTTLREAFDEAHAISKATKAKQYLFSLSLSPPRDAHIDLEGLKDAVERAEQSLGLTGQPRVIVCHEKHGRRHWHCVWSRIDAHALKAINLPYYKTRLNALSRDLFLEHGWELPEGYRTNGWRNPLNFDLAEWQQAQRLGLDPRELKQLFRDAWIRSDSLAGFRHALEESGYFLAQGDRRGFVAVDIHGEVFALARAVGVKTKDITDRLGDPAQLPSVADVHQTFKTRMIERARELRRENRQTQEAEQAPFIAEREAMKAQHQAERERLREGQEQRWQREARERVARLRTGMRGAWDLLTGRARVIRRENERESYATFSRDRTQQEELYRAQMRERRELQARIDALAQAQRQGRRELARRIGALLRPPDPPDRDQSKPFARRIRPRGPSLDR